MNRFVFPRDEHQEELQYTHNLKELKQKIRNFWDNAAPFHKSLYRFRMNLSKNVEHKIHVKCQSCDSRLEYRKVEGEQLWKNVAFQNFHDHSRKLKTKQSKSKEMKKAQNYLKHFIKDFEKEALKQLALSKFSISPSNFNTIYNKIKHKDQETTDFQHFLQKQILPNFSAHYYPPQFQILPNRLLIFNREMKELFKKYGDSIWFTEVKAESQFHKFYAFSGQNNKNRLVIFGIVMIEKWGREEDYEGVLMDLVGSMEDSPRGILIRAEKGIEGAIQRINQKKRMKISHFVDISQQLPKTFIGYPLHQQPPTINPSITQNMTLTQKINQILSYAAHTNQQAQKTWIKTVYQLPFPKSCIDLSALSTSLCSEIFQVFLSQINQASNCNIVQQQKLENIDFWKLKEKENEGLVDYEVKTDKDRKRWECSCYFYLRSGIPCRHIVKARVKIGLKIDELIERRWWVDEEKREESLKRGAGKSTRSNILK